MSAPAIIAVAPAAPSPAAGRHGGAPDAAGFNGMVEAAAGAETATKSDKAADETQDAEPAHQANDDLAEGMITVLMMPAQPPAQTVAGAAEAGAEAAAVAGAAPSFMLAAEPAAAQIPAKTDAQVASAIADQAAAMTAVGQDAAAGIDDAALQALAGEAQAPAAVEPPPRERIRKVGQPPVGDTPRTDATAPPRTAATAPTAEAPSTSGAPSADTAAAVDAVAGEATAPKADAAAHDAAQGPIQTRAADAAAAATAQIHAAAVRGAPETVANMAAKIVKKLDERSSRFDVELDPIGLGKVDVRVEINAQGRMTAAMSFDTPQAAAELRARAGELHRALEQAGFDLSGGMSFDVAGQGGRSQQDGQQQADTGSVFRGRAFQAALATAAGADAAITSRLSLRHALVSGVDIRI